MWLISTANPRGTVLVFPLLLCVSLPVWACVHTRAYPFHRETSVTPPKPTEAGILKAAIARGQGLWELGETLTLDFGTLTSHMTSYETGLFALSSFEHYPKATAKEKYVLRRATAQDTEGHGKEMFYNFDKDGALKMLAMQLL